MKERKGKGEQRIKRQIRINTNIPTVKKLRKMKERKGKGEQRIERQIRIQKVNK
jgi:hypothetical protein